jgi:hypothetical protein
MGGRADGSDLPERSREEIEGNSVRRNRRVIDADTRPLVAKSRQLLSRLRGGLVGAKK